MPLNKKGTGIGLALSKEIVELHHGEIFAANGKQGAQFTVWLLLGKEQYKENVYEHECQVSKLIENVVKVASEEKDMASQDFLWGYVREQVEEEATAQGILEKIRKADKAALLFIDDKLGQRV